MSNWRDKYNSLSDRRKLLVNFLLQWLYWMLAWWLYKWVWPDKDEPLTLFNLLFYATWMAFWMTIVFNWKKVRQLFKKKPNE
ncbi:hypothetical protein [Aridibaculum aurantiacum]|uniref:hypothetical protein n=1 Tax=Aridibaculum aurantiacum TaxID=2810307 RepID=UPI001A977813|nr:hypothetical protein [Aridibaculum aurantiacum]